MKKLMIAAAVVLAGFVAQAVSFSWGGTYVINPAGQGYATGAKVYLFAEGLALDGSALVANAGVTAAAYSALVTAGTFDSSYLANAVGYAEVGSSGGFDGSAGEFTGKDKGDAVSLFTVIVDDTGANTYANYIAGSVGTPVDQFNGTTGKADWKMGNLMNNTYNTGWVAQAVPEPTSGLLLLLGVAGLALKRKRA